MTAWEFRVRKPERRSWPEPDYYCDGDENEARRIARKILEREKCERVVFNRSDDPHHTQVLYSSGQFSFTTPKELSQ